jgi:hypothetical protein
MSAVSHNQTDINLGGVNGGENVGSGADVFKEKDGANLLFRRIEGVNGTLVTQAGDTIQVDGGGGGAPIQSSSFLDNTTLDIPVGFLATDGNVHVDMSLTDTATGLQQSIRWVFGISATSTSADIVQVDADESSPLSQIDPSAESVGPNAVCRLTGTGVGNLIEVRYRVISIPRI